MHQAKYYACLWHRHRVARHRVARHRVPGAWLPGHAQGCQAQGCQAQGCQAQGARHRVARHRVARHRVPGTGLPGLVAWHRRLVARRLVASAWQQIESQTLPSLHGRCWRCWASEGVTNTITKRCRDGAWQEMVSALLALFIIQRATAQFDAAA